MSTTTPLSLAGNSALVTGVARSIGAGIALTRAMARRQSRRALPLSRHRRLG
jgi:NAD(P)-dependent dehydrogenase (short-subunit alcohol dehydrogenase family)